MDFDDLLLKCISCLRITRKRWSKYQRKFKYILIDEYQDTNPAQYEIIKLLGAMHENVCVVVMMMRKASIVSRRYHRNILRFQKDYDDVKVVKLEQITAAPKHPAYNNEVIGNNKGQIEKRLFTDNVEGEAHTPLFETMTDNDEGKMVADSIQEQKRATIISIKILPFFTAPTHRAVVSRKRPPDGNRLPHLRRYQLLSTQRGKGFHRLPAPPW